MTQDRYSQTVAKSIRWILTQQNPDGSLNPLEKGPVAFYKVPRALVMAGEHKAAQKLLDVVQRESFEDNGDFTGKVGTFHEAHWTYANCWFVWAAQVLSRFDMAYRGMSYLLTHRDPHTGGYCARTPYGAGDGTSQQEDMLSTSFTSFVGLHLGLLDEARQGAEFLRQLLDQQPGPQERLFLRMAPDGELITQIPPDDPEPRHYVVETGQGTQFYYFVGAAIAFLAKLYTITNDRSHLDLAEDFLQFAQRCHDDVYETDAAGKICLGCTHLYKITGQEDYRAIARRVGDFLVADQHADGYWMRGGKATASSSAEFCVWLGEFSQIAD